MAEDKNIKLFDMFAGYAFEKMYKSFPLCVEFKPQEDIKTIKHTEDVSEYDNIVFGSTLLWLERNDFIHIQSSFPDNRDPVTPLVYHEFFCVELTLKGLNLLSSPIPKTLDKNSVGDELITKVKSGMYTEAGKLATKAMFDYSLRKLGE